VTEPQEFTGYSVPKVDTPNGGKVDERLAPLMELMAKQGLTPTQGGQGNDKEPAQAPAFLVFPDTGQAVEFMLHTQHHMDYLLGDQMAHTVVHPEGDGPPRGKVSWLPSLTDSIIKAWEKSLL
jgi:hypothetical protein